MAYSAPGDAPFFRIRSRGAGLTGLLVTSRSTEGELAVRGLENWKSSTEVGVETGREGDGVGESEEVRSKE